MKADGLSLDDKRNLLVSEEAFEQCFTQPETMVEAVKGKCDIAHILLEAKSILHSPPQEGCPKDGVAHPKDGVVLQEGCPKDGVERLRTQPSFLVPKQEIIANDWDLSINRYKEIVYEEVAYEKPETLINDIKELDNKRAEALLNLEKIMM